MVENKSYFKAKAALRLYHILILVHPPAPSQRWLVNFTQELRCGLNSKEREPQEDPTEYISKEFVKEKEKNVVTKKKTKKNL